jgi:UDPglucose 6-dehydrogenase/GDP-mannose 6-dehydrogenase
MKVAIIGAGYVGLVTGVCLASKGHDVVCVEKNITKVKKLSKGQATIYEEGLDELLKSVINKKKFFVTNKFNKAINDVSLIIIAVGTPSVNGKINLEAIKDVSKKIGRYISTSKTYVSVVVKSTVLPGTTDTVIQDIIKKSSGKKLGDFGLGMNPEFLREGNAVKDFMYPDRIVLGFEDIKTKKILEKLYSSWKTNKLSVNTRTAEMIKYASNIILATQISTINEIDNLSSGLGGIDMRKVVRGFQLDKRWSPKINKKRIKPEILNYLIPGCGFGGSCFPKDLQAIKYQGVKLGLDMKILDSVLNVNKNQPTKVLKIFEKQFGSLNKKSVIILGLAFKTNTDDVRESPSIKIAKALLKKNINLYAHDPKAMNNFKKAVGITSSKIHYVENWKRTLKNIDIVLLLTPWKQYYELENLKLDNQVIFDARMSLNRKKFQNFKYFTIG